jgi:hypothetical protein
VNHKEEAARVETVQDFEREARRSLKRSWHHEDPNCVAAAIQDAQVWALLHLATQVQRVADLLVEKKP